MGADINLRIGDFEKLSFFLSRPFWTLFKKKENKSFFFASSPWKSVKGSEISRMGWNFDDYPGFQPKIIHPKHFSPQCIILIILKYVRNYEICFPSPHIKLLSYMWKIVPTILNLHHNFLCLFSYLNGILSVSEKSIKVILRWTKHDISSIKSKCDNWFPHILCQIISVTFWQKKVHKSNVTFWFYWKNYASVSQENNL